MLKCSKHSDKKHNRFFDLSKPHVSELLKNLVCYHCEIVLQIVDYASDMATIERLNNTLGHVDSNCVLACRTCNYAKVGSK